MPACLRPADTMPDNVKMGVVIQNMEDGTCNVIKVFMVTGPSLPVRNLKKLATGRAYVPLQRAGPWALKKALQTLLDRIPGYHADLASVTSRPAFQRKKTERWEVPNDELRAGVFFINTQCPEDNDENQQWVWIQENIKGESGSPIAGWPEAKVQKAADNKCKGAMAGAKVERWFPLLIFDLHPIWMILLPVLFPLMAEYGVLLLGLPGIGKTPTFITLAMTMCRYWCRARPQGGQAGWRRGRMFDNFKNRVSKVYEAVFLDDPGLSAMDIVDLKQFFDVGEDSFGQARYNPAKLARNGPRGLADNEFDENDEPSEDDRTSITAEEGLKLCKKPFGNQGSAHVMAVLKRTITIIGGRHAVYLRLPSQSEVGMIHRIAAANFAKDWLQEKNKKFYGMYKRNVERYPVDYQANLEKEKEFVDAAMASRGDKTPENFVKECDEKLQTELLRIPSPIPRRVVPPSPDASQTQDDVLVVRPDADGHYRIPLLQTGGPSSSMNDLFNMGGADRRVRRRTKSGVVASQAVGAAPPAERANDVGSDEDPMGFGYSLG